MSKPRQSPKMYLASMGLTSLAVLALRNNFPLLTFRKNSSRTESGFTGVLAYFCQILSRWVTLVEETRFESKKCSTWLGHIHRS